MNVYKAACDAIHAQQVERINAVVTGPLIDTQAIAQAVYGVCEPILESLAAIEDAALSDALRHLEQIEAHGRDQVEEACRRLAACAIDSALLARLA